MSNVNAICNCLRINALAKRLDVRFVAIPQCRRRELNNEMTKPTRIWDHSLKV
jgi:hypothetical protein